MLAREIDAIITAALGLEPEDPGLGARPAHIPAATVSHADMALPETEYPPADAEKIADECAVLDLVRGTRGLVDQPTWFHTIQILSKCVDGEEFAHEWSKGDSRYRASQVNGILARVADKGPTTCAKFGELHPDLCSVCPHAGKIKSPIWLGVEQRPLQSNPVASGIVSATLSQAFASTPSNTLATLLVNRPVHKRQPEHGRLCHIGEVTVIGAPGASGKTSYIVSAAIALASGVPLLGQRIYRRRRVLMVILEECLPEVLLKLTAALAYFRQRFQLPADTEGFISVYGSGDLPGFTFTHIDPVTRRESVNKPALAEFSDIIERSGAEIAFIDPLSQAMPYGGNDQGIGYQAMQAVKQIAADRRCAIVLSAHTRKQPGGAVRASPTVDDVMGTAAVPNAARQVVTISRVDPADRATLGIPYGCEGNVREIIDQKSNFAPLAERCFIEMVGVRVPNAQPPDYPDDDWVGVAVEFKPQLGGRSLPLPALRATLMQLAVGTNGGAAPYSPAKQGGRHYQQDVAAAIAPAFAGAPAARLAEAAKEALQELLSSGAVVEEDHKIGRNMRKGLIVVWANTPFSADPAPGGAYVR